MLEEICSSPLCGYPCIPHGVPSFVPHPVAPLPSRQQEAEREQDQISLTINCSTSLSRPMFGRSGIMCETTLNPASLAPWKDSHTARTVCPLPCTTIGHTKAGGVGQQRGGGRLIIAVNRDSNGNTCDVQDTVEGCLCDPTHPQRRSTTRWRTNRLVSRATSS